MTSTTAVNLPAPLDEKLLLGLTTDQQELIQNLYQLGQSHLFEHWSDASTEDKQRLASQLIELDAGYSDGGLVGYIRNARRLLENSCKGINPLEGWFPSVPQGQTLELGTPNYQAMEEKGLPELGSVGFVLVAGGLGERLGYSNIKIGLPTEMTTETCYIQYYIEYILAVQDKYGNGKRLPLCIMTSGDTNDRTIQLLQKHNYFGMDPTQVTIVQQGRGVPALLDNQAKFEVSSRDPFQIVTKPHGHGDIHELLHRHCVASKWLQDGLKWLILFQDTNGLAFHTLPLLLGVSKQLNLILNSLAVPRKAKQAIGGIAKLTQKESGAHEPVLLNLSRLVVDETFGRLAIEFAPNDRLPFVLSYRTINVEYNQLDPMLRATPGYEDGDVNDPQTGYSPFPGNINQLLFHLESYVRILDQTQGLMPEFVNPKYQDETTKTVFKKPTRLECMMQDFPTVLTGEDTDRVGFTSVTADLCFSPVKNATSEGVKLQANGTQPGTAASGEADQYAAVRNILRSIGCHIEEAPVETYLGINVVPGPAIVLKSNFVCCPAEYRTKFPNPDQIKISSRSTLVVNGSGVVLEKLDLDGALVIDCAPGQTMIVNRTEQIRNKGWIRVHVESSEDEIIKMRGYRIERCETEHIQD